MQEHTTPCTLVPMAYKSISSATFLYHIWADHGWVDTQSHTLTTGLATSLLIILQLKWISDGVIASQCLIYSTCTLLLDAVKWLALVIQYQPPTFSNFVYLCSVLMVSKSMEQCINYFKEHDAMFARVCLQYSYRISDRNAQDNLCRKV